MRTHRHFFFGHFFLNGGSTELVNSSTWYNQYHRLILECAGRVVPVQTLFNTHSDVTCLKIHHRHLSAVYLYYWYDSLRCRRYHVGCMISKGMIMHPVGTSFGSLVLTTPTSTIAAINRLLVGGVASRFNNENDMADKMVGVWSGHF